MAYSVYICTWLSIDKSEKKIGGPRIYRKHTIFKSAADEDVETIAKKATAESKRPVTALIMREKQIIETVAILISY